MLKYLALAPILFVIKTVDFWKKGFYPTFALQFIGHAIEGKRPSFFKDLQFLLIGPACVRHSGGG